MSKEMIVSVNGREKKIAILENGKVTEFYIERGEENQGVAGNVYKGRVMRVLPGMQSAFVDIGLERDAFLYVSDFFDEDEEIERIVMEKSKKTSPEEAKREAHEQIDRSRIEREKQMESAQEITEPLAESGVSLDEDEVPRELEARDEGESQQEREQQQERGSRSRRGRGRKGRDNEPQAAAPAEEPTPVFEVEFDNSGFERISDDSETGEMFKDAYLQEAIVHKVRTVEFDMEGTAVAEVGSLLDDVTADSSGFERIADEDDEPAAPVKGRGRSKPAKSDDKEVKPATKAKTSKAAAKKPAAAKSKSAKGKKAKGEDVLEDAEASVRESDERSEMAVRRGGRGRRRGGAKPKSADGVEGGSEEILDGEGSEAPAEEFEAVMAEPAAEVEPVEAAPETEPETAREASDEQPSGNERNRGGRSRGGRGRGDRGDRQGGERQSSDRQGGERPSGDRPSGDRPSGDRPSGDRPSGDRPSGDRPSGDRDRGGRGRNDRGGRGDRAPQPAISDLLREGQEILVQIAKEPIAKKGARITSHIALPGDSWSICRRSSTSACHARSSRRVNAAVCEH